MEHCMHFSEPTVFVTLGGGTRKQDEYENDLVRITSLKQIYDDYLTKQWKLIHAAFAHLVTFMFFQISLIQV